LDTGIGFCNASELAPGIFIGCERRKIIETADMKDGACTSR
jgi:hypothetical protein